MQTAKPKRTRRKSKDASKDRYYFTSAVDDAIVRYNATEDPYDRSLIYQQDIRAPFEKLVEFIINTFKYYRFGDQTPQQAQQEVVGFLVEKLGKFKPESGKAFSYFSMVAKHFCIQRNKANYKKLTSHHTLSSIGDSSLENRLVADSFDESQYAIQQFQNTFVEYWDANLDRLCPKKGDKYIAAAVLELFRRRDTLELFNKKALYIYVREISDISGSPKPTTTPQITKIVKVIKGKYKEMYKDYLTHGHLLHNRVY